MKFFESEFMAMKEFMTPYGPVEESIRILSALENLPQFKEARTVLVYVSMSGEVRTREFLERWQALGKRVVLPKVVGKKLELREYHPEMLSPGYCGIAEPSDSAPEVKRSEVDLAVIPGVAFSCQKDENGVERYYRLGRGGGFYDGLLSELKCPFVGVCFPFRIVEELPLEAWDVPIDIVLS